MLTARTLHPPLIEDLHDLILSNGVDETVTNAIAGVTELTVSGLVEYGVLRWQFKGLPPLPSHVMQGVVGTAITKARSLEDRAAVTTGNSDEDMMPRECEFLFFRSEGDLLSKRADFFQYRFGRSAQAAGFPVGVASCLQAGLNEMMDNAVRHALAPARIVSGYHVREGTAQFVVADVGRGILESLRESPKYKSLTKHTDAINLAIRDGVTSDEGNVGGRGFNDIFKAIASQWGLLRFRSRAGCVTIDGRGASADAGTVTFPPELPGFQVSVTCRVDPSALGNA